MISNINKRFFLLAIGNAERRETDNDIAVRCPICGDSRTKRSSKRLHIYHKNGKDFVNCFNSGCPAENKTMYSFLRDFYPSLFEQFKRENFSNQLQQLASGEDVFASLKQKEEPKKQIITHHDLTPYLKDISEVPEALQYLKNRLCDYNENKYGKWYFGYQDLQIGDTLYKITNSIIIPLYEDGKMYGFYSRNIYKKDFYTYNPECNIGYKIWNWFNVDKEQPVFIYEGIFDAISGGLPNSIALMGAKLPDDRLQELKRPVFVLDNDRTGLKNSLMYCNKAEVYIQPNKYPEKDMNELKKNHNIDIPKMITSNLFSGINAEVLIKAKL